VIRPIIAQFVKIALIAFKLSLAVHVVRLDSTHVARREGGRTQAIAAYSIFIFVVGVLESAG